MILLGFVYFFAVPGVPVSYYRQEGSLLPRGLAFSLPVCGYPSGFMSAHRGLSWSRRSRRGVK